MRSSPELRWKPIAYFRQSECDVVHISGLLWGRRGMPSLRDHVAVREPHGDHVVAGLREGLQPDLVEADLEIILVDVDPQVAVIVVVVFRQKKMLDLGNAALIEIADIGPGDRLQSGLAALRPDQSVDVMPTVAADDEGH